MVQNELVLVFQDADLDAQLHGDARLAFADPFGVRLEDREYFLVVRDDFSENDPASRLVDLACGVPYVRNLCSTSKIQ